MEKQIKGLIAKPKNAVLREFKGEVVDTPIKFPKELGAAHPYDFTIAQGLYNSFPFTTGAIDKHVDSIVSDFQAQVKNPNAQALVDKFIQDTSFQVSLREWVKSALITGNGFMELDLDKSQVRVLDPTTMYVKRDVKGNVKEYNQYLGKFNGSGTITKSKVIRFNSNQIAHLKINEMPGKPYGWGLAWPNRIKTDQFIQSDKDMHLVTSRKASNPYHVKIGVPGEAVAQADIDLFNEKLEYLNNRTEWVTDANVEIKGVDFGNIGEKFAGILDHDNQQLIYGYQVPAVLMGVANVPEGLAKVQMEAFQRRIKSMQEAIEKVIEEKVFKPLMNNQENEQFDMHVEVVWNLPGESEINNRVDRLNTIIGQMSASINLKRMAELDIAQTLGIQDAEKYLAKPDVALMKMDEELARNPPEAENPEREEEENIQQPEVPGAKPSANEKNTKSPCKCTAQLTENDIRNMPVKEWISLKEASGFKYSDYLANIISVLKTDSFDNLVGVTEEQIDLGLLPKEQIDKLRISLKDGFQKNKTIVEMEQDVQQHVDIKDRYIMKGDEKVLSASAATRPINIVRTETVRLASKGLLKTFKDAKIKEVRFLAALSERTCAECESLNGRVFTMQESGDMIPVHSMCRCTWTTL